MAPLLRAAALLAVLGTLSACGYRGAASLPLPGGVGRDGYSVTMVLDDATNLVPQETCRAGDVVVGSVESITLRRDLKAEVVCRVKADVRLPANVAPTLRETSLLGERFVALDPPAGERPSGVLARGAELTSSPAHVVPDVELVLGALSQLLNGGGLDNVETISRELSTALNGADLGDTTRTVHRLVSTLDDNRDEIVRALDGLDRFAAELEEQREVIETALDAIPGGLEVLDEERPRLVRTLNELGTLREETVPFLQRTKGDTIADFRHLTRILNNLARSKHRLADAVEAISTFPFPSYTKYVTKGDFTGMHGLYALDIDSLNRLLATKAPGIPLPGAAQQQPGAAAPAAKPAPGATATPGTPRVTVPLPPLTDRKPAKDLEQVIDNLLESLSLGGRQ